MLTAVISGCQHLHNSNMNMTIKLVRDELLRFPNHTATLLWLFIAQQIKSNFLKIIIILFRTVLF